MLAQAPKEVIVNSAGGKLNLVVAHGIHQGDSHSQGMSLVIY